MEYTQVFPIKKQAYNLHMRICTKSRKPWVTSPLQLMLLIFFPQLLCLLVHLFNISTFRANADHHPEEATKTVICELFAFKGTHSRSSHCVLCAHTMPPVTVSAEFGPVGTFWGAGPREPGSAALREHSHCTALTQPVLLSRFRVCGK